MNKTKDAAYYLNLKKWQEQVLFQIVQEQKDKEWRVCELLQTAQNREIGLEKMRKAVAAPEFVPGIGLCQPEVLRSNDSSHQ